jgi:hypothetical protein
MPTPQWREDFNEYAGKMLADFRASRFYRRSLEFLAIQLAAIVGLACLIYYRFQGPRMAAYLKSKWTYYNRWLGAFVVSFLVFLPIGYFVYEADGHYWGHFFLELSVASLVLFLTVYLVEKLLEVQRGERFDVIKKRTIEELHEDIRQIIVAAVKLGDDDPGPDELENWPDTSILMQELDQRAQPLKVSSLKNWYMPKVFYSLKENVFRQLSQIDPKHPVIDLVMQINQLAANIDEIPALKEGDFPDAVELISDYVIDIVRNCCAIHQKLIESE